jgi:hypothetical protein
VSLRFALFPAALIIGLVPGASSQSGSTPARADSLPLRLRVSDNGLSPAIGKLCRVQAGRGFRYAGGQRFVLKQVADAEQHFFLSADSGGTVRQLYWLQAEELLPGVQGGYDYTADTLRTVATLPWWVSLRSVGGPSQPGSDRSAALAHLAARGFRFPALAPRLRLVYVPEPRGRREFMIVYLEAAALAGADTGLDAVLARARQGLELSPAPEGAR